MKQKTDVQRRAEKEYKNSREKFHLLLREVISNAIHTVIMRSGTENGFVPEVSLDVLYQENNCQIVVRDNGEGFTENNRRCFEELDCINAEKERLNFNPKGQGRLAVVYFSNSARYESVFKNSQGKCSCLTFPYPDNEIDDLFSIESIGAESCSSQIDTYTKLTLVINKADKFNRAKTFFRNHSNIDDLKNWVLETFFPFIFNNPNLELKISINGSSGVISHNVLKTEVENSSFSVAMSDNTNQDFTVWMIKKSGSMKGDNDVLCFARDLQAELLDKKLIYTIDSEIGYSLYLTSKYFDQNVDNKGDRIEIPPADIDIIQAKLNNILDEKFSSAIYKNRKQTEANYSDFKKNFPSLQAFVTKETASNGKRVVQEKDFIKSAVEGRARIEKQFWQTEYNKDDDDSFSDSEDAQKLLNSSLSIYVKHRQRVLKRLHTLIQRFNSEGDVKRELESAVHDLIVRRGKTLESDRNINHLHNLWILDDKFTTFSNDFKAKSTKTGQALSDVYIWADMPERTKEILILELKSTTNAHNPGDREEGMIAQVKRYAQRFYRNPDQTLNWSINPNNVRYTGVILARKSDINKEITSNNSSGGYEKIPFLGNSYAANTDSFYIDNDPDRKVNIRIELYSYEDIYELASDRNKVFFKLLNEENLEVISDLKV